MGEDIAISKISIDDLEPKIHQMVRRMGLDVQSIKRISETGLLVRAWKVSMDETVPFAILVETSERTSSSQLYPLVQAKVKGRIAIGEVFTDDAKELADMKGLYLVDGATFTKMVTELRLVHVFKDYMSVPVIDPTDSKRSLEWAMEVCARGELEKAHEMFSNIISNEPDNKDARYFRARCSVDREMYDEAERDLGYLLKLDGGNVDALSLLAHVHHARGDPEGEIEAYHMILKAHPKELDAWVNLGVAFAETGDEEHAISSFKNAIAINASDARAWNNLGILLRRRKDIEGARGAFARLVNITPEDEGAWANLISASMALNDLTQAMSDATNFEEQGIKGMEGHLTLAWVYHASGDDRRAGEHLASAKSISSNAEKIWRELAPDWGIEPPGPPERRIPEAVEPEPAPEPALIPEPEIPIEPLAGKAETRPIILEAVRQIEKKEEETTPKPIAPEEKTVEHVKVEVQIPQSEKPITEPVQAAEPESKLEPSEDVVKKEEIDALLKDISRQIPEPVLTKVPERTVESSPELISKEPEPIAEVKIPDAAEKPTLKVTHPRASVDDILSLLEEQPKPPKTVRAMKKSTLPLIENVAEPKTNVIIMKKSQEPEGSVEDILSLLEERSDEGKGTGTQPAAQVSPPSIIQMVKPTSTKREVRPPPPPPPPTGSDVDDIMALLSAPAPTAERETRRAAPIDERKTTIEKDQVDEPRQRTAQEPSGGTSRERLAAARMSLTLGEHDELRDLLEKERGSEVALIRASSLISDGRGREAHAILRDLGPSTEVVRGKVSALIQTGDWGSALGELKSLPEGIEKTLIRIVSLSHLRKYDDALQVIDGLDTSVPLFRALRGLVLHKAGRVDDALAQYNEAVNDEPTLFFAWHNMSVIYAQKGRREEARTCVENAEEVWKDYT